MKDVRGKDEAESVEQFFFFPWESEKKTKTVQTAEVVVQGKNENEMKCEMLSSWDHNGASVLMLAQIHLLQCL